MFQVIIGGVAFRYFLFASKKKHFGRVQIVFCRFRNREASETISLLS